MSRVAQWAERAVEVARRRSAAMLLPALAVACIGWATFPFSSYESDPERLVSPNLPAFKDLTAIRQATGSSGEMDFILSGPDVTSPDALSWVKDLESAAQKDTQGRFRPVASLSSLLNDVTGGKDLTADRIKALLAVMPQFFTSALIDSCPSREPCQHHLARVAFGINLAPVAQQQKDVEAVLNDVGPPAGYSYYAAGLSYLGVKGLENLESGQLVLNLLAAALVLIALLAIYRQRVAALLAWAPTLLVAGWSSAVLFVLQQSLTPMTAVLGALIVAFGTEFAVLWLERYREARTAGVAAGEAAARQASRAAAPGIAVSGAALALGFLALAVSVLPGLSQRGFDMPMVRNFGLVAAMDIVLAVLAALVVLPALVVRFKLDPAAAHPATEERRT